jgi:hypothetical protein
VLSPYWEALGVPTNRVVRCLLAQLPPGVTIPVHHDTGLWVKHTHRIHVPVVTDIERVVFRAGPCEESITRYALDVGGIYELNNQSKHFVANHGARHATPRHATPRRATPRHAAPRRATPRHAAPRLAATPLAATRRDTPRSCIHSRPRNSATGTPHLRLRGYG